MNFALPEGGRTSPSFRLRLILFVFGIFVVALLSGCSGLSKKPEISLAGVDLVGLGLAEQRFVLKLRINNPNEVDLLVKALDFDLELEGQHFARGVSEQPVSVPRRGEAILEVKVVSRLSTVLKPLREARKDGRSQVAYRMYGNVELDGMRRYPFERKGDISLSVLDKFSLK